MTTKQPSVLDWWKLGACIVCIALLMGWGVLSDHLPVSLLLCYWPARRLGRASDPFAPLVTAYVAGCGVATVTLNTPRWHIANLAGPLLLGIITFFSWLDHCRQEKLQETDSLTGLLNRRGFEARVRLGAQLAFDLNDEPPATIVACLDCDNFKEFNDTFGHRAGDHFLIQAAKVIVDRSGSKYAGRLGGDEFCVCWFGFPPDNPQQLAKELQQHLATIESPTARPITWSIGIAVFTESLPIEEMIDRADHLMLAGKRTGKGTSTFQINPPAPAISSTADQS